MDKRILVAYATKCGSTAEVAHVVAHILGEAGGEVDVRSVSEVQDLSPYGAIVLGTAVRMGRPLPAARHFVRKHHAALAGVPVALFSLGITMKADTPENRAKAESFLRDWIDSLHPVSVGLFGGRVDPDTLSPMWRLATSFVRTNQLITGDYRDWHAIRLWANRLVPLLLVKA